MRAMTISKDGTEAKEAWSVQAKNGQEYFALHHGQEGRGRWEVRIPLARREFPTPEEFGNKVSMEGIELKLIDLKKEDPRGNKLWLLAKGNDDGDGEYLIFWELSPGYRGGAKYKISGNAEMITCGVEAQGAAGYMGGADCPVVHVTGPCRLEWTRTGRLYGDKAEWVADFDGKSWTVSPFDICALEDAVLNY